MSTHHEAGIHRLPTFDQSTYPSRRMIGALLQTVAQFFDESGCPLTEDQCRVMGAAIAEVERGDAA